MDIKDIIGKIEHDIKQGKENGEQTIDVDKMLSYLEQLKASSAVELDTARLQAQFAHEWQLAYEKNTIDTLSRESANMFKAVLETGASAIKSVIL